MAAVDHLSAVRRGKLSRRAFNKILVGAGIGMLTTPLASRRALAQDNEQSIFFTWGGYDIPELDPTYEATNDALPNFSILGGTEEALTKMRGGFTPDVAHPCYRGASGGSTLACSSLSTPPACPTGAM